MSEEVTKVEEENKASETAEVPVQKSKQYLLMADELHIALLGKLMPGLLYVQVEGLAVEGKPGYMLLVNPVKKEEETQPVEAEGAGS